LTEALREAGFRTHIETSGVCETFTGTWDWICFSPKKFKAPNEAILPYVHELKVVIFHPSDVAWAQDWVSQINTSAHLYMQPEWSKQTSMNPLIVEFVKANPNWQISVQTHKFLQIP